jgi:predicted transposase YbfD/YdcC
MPAGAKAAGRGLPARAAGAAPPDCRRPTGSQVDGAPGEVPGFRPLLADLDLAGTVVTADALRSHADAAEFLVTGKQADYLFTVKANRPTLLARCAALAWSHVPVGDRTCDRGHGRVELRTLKAVSVGHFGLPHAAQVLQVTRKVRELGARRWRTVTVYAIISLPFERARPARLADLVRGHWAIENSLHYPSDVALAEDGSQVRTGAAPHVIATLRNLVIGAVPGRGRSTSPPRYATTPATRSGPWPPSGSFADEPAIRENAGALG